MTTQEQLALRQKQIDALFAVSHSYTYNKTFNPWDFYKMYNAIFNKKKVTFKLM